jgi:uncharacterized protein
VVDKSYILQRIKDSVYTTEPTATVILYGSYARGDNREDSDIDILVLVDKEKQKTTYEEETKITHPIYSVEFETGTLISPIVYTKQAWANHRVTPFYENVNKEGKPL